MTLRPGSLFEMSSHFIPLPRSEIIKASSSGPHFELCFFAGDAEGWVFVGGGRLLIIDVEAGAGVQRHGGQGGHGIGEAGVDHRSLQVLQPPVLVAAVLVAG